jgi:hypothetical protein
MTLGDPARTPPPVAENAEALHPQARPSPVDPWAVWKRVGITYGPLVVAVGLLAWRAIAAVLAKLGHAGATLDDAYIHFQYARAIAEGHPLRFQAGEPFTSGATSMLWPAVLAPFWALGFRGDAMMWPAWALSFVALGGLAWETARLTERLAGRTAAVGAGAMTIAFGGLLWCAASGMEVVPFAWAIARASRRASEWAEAPAPERTDRRARELVALAWTAALFRPEGALTALFVGTTLGVFPRSRAWRSRLWSLAAAAAVLALPLLLWALTGTVRSNTAVAKLLPGNPYYTGAALRAAVETNASVLVHRLLNGEAWSAEFVPHAAAPIAMAGLGAVAVLGARTRVGWRAAAVLLIALTMFAPCFYYTFLWNRLRYLWPFAPGWIVGAACLARVAGDVAGAVRSRWRVVTPLACGAMVGLFASKDEWVLDDVAQSASGIDRQQVALGRWAKDNLPGGARLGVNDTGAIAYFSDKKTFDVVGLTTSGEARYWVAGVGSRLEHYERMRASAPGALPTHFIVYPEWMGTDILFGPRLHEATVTDSTILGGQTMRVYEADWSSLGTGEVPWSDLPGPVVDTLDVADLESEAAHDYELLDARENEEVAEDGVSPAGAVVVDGGRSRRRTERFVAHARPGVTVRVVVRLEAPPDTHVAVLERAVPVARLDVGVEQEWQEASFEIPASAVEERMPLELRFSAPVTVYHYWFVAER